MARSWLTAVSVLISALALGGVPASHAGQTLVAKMSIVQQGVSVSRLAYVVNGCPATGPAAEDARHGVDEAFLDVTAYRGKKLLVQITGADVTVPGGLISLNAWGYGACSLASSTTDYANAMSFTVSSKDRFVGFDLRQGGGAFVRFSVFKVT